MYSFRFLGDSILDPVFSLLFSFSPHPNACKSCFSFVHFKVHADAVPYLNNTSVARKITLGQKKRGIILCHTDGWIFCPHGNRPSHLVAMVTDNRAFFGSPKLTSGHFLTGMKKGPLQWSQACIKQKTYQAPSPLSPHTLTHLGLGFSAKGHIPCQGSARVLRTKTRTKTSDKKRSKHKSIH